MQYSKSAQQLEIAKSLFMNVVWYHVFFFLLITSAFYTDYEYVVADYLVRHKYLSEKDVAEDKVLKLHHKYVFNLLKY